MSATHPHWQIKLLHDSLCPLCAHEVRFLRRLDRRGNVAFQDIADPTFDPAQYGLTLDQVVGSIHAVLPNGQTVHGLEVFRQVYKAAGYGWIYAPTGWPLLRPLFDQAYKLFAKIRPRLSRFDPKSCTTNRCKIP